MNASRCAVAAHLSCARACLLALSIMESVWALVRARTYKLGSRRLPTTATVFGSRLAAQLASLALGHDLHCGKRASEQRPCFAVLARCKAARQLASLAAVGARIWPASVSCAHLMIGERGALARF